MDTNRRGFLIGATSLFAAPAIVRASSLMPVKVVRSSVFPFEEWVPGPDWLPCYGQQLSRARYAELFRALGTVYGVGDGLTTFNLPDLRGRIHSVTASGHQPVLLVEHRIATRELAHDRGVPGILPGQIYPTLTKTPLSA